jgi:hypothetical protein
MEHAHDDTRSAGCEIGTILEESEVVLAPYRSASGNLAFDMHAHIVSARTS